MVIWAYGHMVILYILMVIWAYGHIPRYEIQDMRVRVSDYEIVSMRYEIWEVQEYSDTPIRWGRRIIYGVSAGSKAWSNRLRYRICLCEPHITGAGRWWRYPFTYIKGCIRDTSLGNLVSLSVSLATHLCSWCIIELLIWHFVKNALLGRMPTRA